MAITLVTGLPGHGKTLYTLATLKAIGEKEGRPIFHNGIPGLALPWQSWDVEKWEQLPAGAIFIVDECQKSFPVRGRGDVPPYVQALATHRHLGIDIYLITQNPMLLDAFARRLVDRHFHVVRKFGTHHATVHEFPNGVKETVATSREGSIRHEWKYPKQVFELYKSAELHTVKRRIPMRVWLLLCVPVVFIALLWVAWQRLNPAAVAERQGVAPAPATGSPVPGQAVASAAPPLDWFAAQVPRIASLPHTAPVYDAITAPVRVPYPAACLSMGDRCTCYTDQATRLAVDVTTCRAIAAGGFFIAWAQAAAPGSVASAPAGVVVPAVDASPPGVGGIRSSGVGLFARPAENVGGS